MSDMEKTLKKIFIIHFGKVFNPHNFKMMFPIQTGLFSTFFFTSGPEVVKRAYAND